MCPAYVIASYVENFRSPLKESHLLMSIQPSDNPIYFVTGATGFLGKQLVLEISRNDPNAKILVLLRSIETPEFDEWLSSRLQSLDNIVKVQGDITLNDCGLESSVIEMLASSSLAVFHCAAHYDLSCTETAIDTLVNVDGTSHVIALAERCSAKSFHHVSSIAVAGDYHGFWTEENFDEINTWPNSYGASKHQAERLVRNSSVPSKKIYRLGVLLGDTNTGSYFKEDGVYSFFPLLNNFTRRVPSTVPLPTFGWGAVPLCPVDYAARAIFVLSKNSTAEVSKDTEVFHVFEDEVLRADDIVRLVLEVAGHRRTFNLSWLSHATSVVSDRSKLDGVLSGIITDFSRILKDFSVPLELFYQFCSPTQFDNTATSAKLAKLGVFSSRFADYVPRIWHGWVAESALRSKRERETFFLGKRVAITGATSGIGKKMMMKVIDRGGEVIVLGRNPDKFTAGFTSGAARDRVKFVHCDLLSNSSIDTAAASLKQMGSIDILINSAGLSIDRPFALMSTDLRGIARMTQTNFLGPLRIIRALLDTLVEQEGARVVTLSSVSTQLAVPGFGAYSATKAALDQMFTVLSTELAGTGVGFTSVKLPLVKSPMTRPNRRLRNVPMLSENDAAELILSAIVSGEREVSHPVARLFEVVRVINPSTASSLSTIGSQIFIRAPYIAKLLGNRFH
jgi:short-chain dehydrogenase/reductase family oxidoreductase